MKEVSLISLGQLLEGISFLNPEIGKNILLENFTVPEITKIILRDYHHDEVVQLLWSLADLSIDFCKGVIHELFDKLINHQIKKLLKELVVITKELQTVILTTLEELGKDITFLD